MTKHELIMNTIVSKSITLNPIICDVMFNHHTDKQLSNQLTKSEKQSILHTHFEYHIKPLSDSITRIALTILEKGRFSEKSENFVMSNYKAMDLLNHYYTDTFIDDLKQETALIITNEFKAGNITLIDSDNDTVRVKAKKDNIEAIRHIFNAVQAYLYSHEIRHSKRAYYINDITTNEDGEIIEDIQLYTKSMHEYDMSISNLNYRDLMHTMSFNLSDIQKRILMYKLHGSKIVKHSNKYTIDGKTVYKIEDKSVKLTNEDIADILKVHVKTIRYNLDLLRVKLQKYLMREANTPISDEYKAPYTNYMYEVFKAKQATTRSNISANSSILKNECLPYPENIPSSNDNLLLEAWLFNRC